MVYTTCSYSYPHNKKLKEKGVEMLVCGLWCSIVINKLLRFCKCDLKTPDIDPFISTLGVKMGVNIVKTPILTPLFPLWA